MRINRKEYQAMQEELMFARCNRGKKLYTAGSEVWYMHMNEACKGKILVIHIKVIEGSIEDALYNRTRKNECRNK